MAGRKNPKLTEAQLEAKEAAEAEALEREYTARIGAYEGTML